MKRRALGLRMVSHRVDAGVDADQVAAPDPVANLARREPCIEQLPSRHLSELALCPRLDLVIRVTGSGSGADKAPK